MFRKTVLLVAILILVALAGCTAPDDDQGDAYGADVDPRIPPADDPGWEPIREEGLPREMMEQPFQRTVFLQEPAAAEEEGNNGTQGFDMDQANETVGPLEEGGTFTPDRTFPPAWEIEFTDVNWDNRSVTYTQDIEDGTYYDIEALPGGMTVVLADDESTLAFSLDLEEDARFYVESQSELAQAGFAPGAYHVVSVEEDTIHLDHHPAEEEPAAPPGPQPRR